MSRSNLRELGIVPACQAAVSIHRRGAIFIISYPNNQRSFNLATKLPFEQFCSTCKPSEVAQHVARSRVAAKIVFIQFRICSPQADEQAQQTTVKWSPCRG